MARWVLGENPDVCQQLLIRFQAASTLGGGGACGVSLVTAAARHQTSNSLLRFHSNWHSHKSGNAGALHQTPASSGAADL